MKPYGWDSHEGLYGTDLEGIDAAHLERDIDRGVGHLAAGHLVDVHLELPSKWSVLVLERGTRSW